MMRIIGALLVLALAGGAQAATLRYAGAAPLISMDPHAKTDVTHLSFLSNIYETLVRRDERLQLEPALAVSWSNPSPTVTRFALRPGVKWQDGTPLTADDVVFSFQRAQLPRSEARVTLGSIKEVRAVDPATVEIETKWPDPLMVEKTYVVAIMQKAWATAGHAEAPVDPTGGGGDNAAYRTAMGTGPFMLKRFEPNGPAVAVVNPGWWDKPRHNLTEVTYQPVASAATRTAALLSGEIDLDYSVPPQDIDRLRATPGLKVVDGPEIRTIFLALDQARDELLNSSVKGRNPFKDLRVRQAVAQAIDVAAIHSRVMRNQSRPNALMWAPAVNGYDQELDVRLPFNPDAAKRLLAEAGYPDGFQVGMDCPNDRFLNDEDTCRAIVAMLARVGIKVDLTAQASPAWYAKLLPNYAVTMTLAGWAPLGVYDAGYTLSGVLACRAKGGSRGIFNLSGYCNPELDQLIDASDRELDKPKRLALLKTIAQRYRDDLGHIPIHDTYIAWAMKQAVEPVQTADDIFTWRYVTVH